MGDQEIMDAERRMVLPAEEFDRIVGELERSGRVLAPLVEVAERDAPTDAGAEYGTPPVSTP